MKNDGFHSDIELICKSDLSEGVKNENVRTKLYKRGKEKGKWRYKGRLANAINSNGCLAQRRVSTTKSLPRVRRHDLARNSEHRGARTPTRILSPADAWGIYIVQNRLPRSFNIVMRRILNICMYGLVYVDTMESGLALQNDVAVVRRIIINPNNYRLRFLIKTTKDTSCNDYIIKIHRTNKRF